MGNQEITESTFRTKRNEQTFVLRIGVHSQTNSENERSHTRNEAREKRIERESTDDAAIHKLNNTSEENVHQVRVQ